VVSRRRNLDADYASERKSVEDSSINDKDPNWLRKIKELKRYKGTHEFIIGRKLVSDRSYWVVS
jgi:hypothetical protein